MRPRSPASSFFVRAAYRFFLPSISLFFLLAGLSNAGESSALQKALAANNEREYLAGLASLRYYKTISATDVDALRSVWASGGSDYRSSELSKLMVSENLYRFDPDRRAEYLPFLISSTQSGDENIRADAYSVLGSLRVEEALPMLLGAVERADFKEALSSGYGLASYERDDVYMGLCEALGRRAKQDEVAKKVSAYLWSRRHWQC